MDNLLIQIRQQVTPKWYQFGLAVGINKETLDEFSNFPPEECIVEMLDLWLRTSERAITWRDVADALKQIGLYQLAERTLKTYKTGKIRMTLCLCNSFLPIDTLHCIILLWKLMCLRQTVTWIWSTEHSTAKSHTPLREHGATHFKTT